MQGSHRFLSITSSEFYKDLIIWVAASLVVSFPKKEATRESASSLIALWLSELVLMMPFLLGVFLV